MASLLTTSAAKAAQAESSSKRKRLAEDEEGEDESHNVKVGEPSMKKKKNKQRVLLLSSRGITHRMRHLMNDLETLLPHVKKGVWSLNLFANNSLDLLN